MYHILLCFWPISRLESSLLTIQLLAVTVSYHLDLLLPNAVLDNGLLPVCYKYVNIFQGSLQTGELLHKWTQENITTNYSVGNLGVIDLICRPIETLLN